MDTFDEIVQPLLLDYEPEEDLNDEVYGIRVLVTDVTGQHYRSVLVPWLSYSLDRAESMRHTAIHTPRGLSATAQWCVMILGDEHNWVPTAARIVRLAEIPF